MRGVDLLDSHLGRQRIHIKSKKWYFRLFYHFIDITVTNSWIMYKRFVGDKIRLKDFIGQVRESLCKVNSKITKRGRPSNSTDQSPNAPKRKFTHLPQPNVRLDGVHHFPDKMDKRQKCKNSNCNKLTFKNCIKCNTTLCFNKDRNCFKFFHGCE